jgi:hypothetical protein
MNERLQLKNFGPIKQLDISIKPLTVLIGESGSGKSAVLKLLSLLRWAHKRNHLRSYFIKNGLANENDFSSISFGELLAMSGLDEFVKQTTEIVFTIGKTTYMATAKELISPVIEEDFSLDKVLFLSDNRVILPDILGYYFNLNVKFPYHLEDTFLNFNHAMKSFRNGFAIESTEVRLTREKTAFGEAYFISNTEGNKEESFHIKFENASSGIKAVSFVELITHFYTHDHLFNFNEVLENQYKRLGIGGTDIKPWKGKKNLSIFIEEPELSLFPEAQRRLLHRLIKDCFSSMENDVAQVHLAFATHSPYILASLNNLLLAGETAKKLEKQELVKVIIPQQYWLTEEQVGAYAIEKGYVKDIIEEDLLINGSYLDGLSDEISREFSAILDIEYGN